jgi:sulfofructose kinase
VFSRARKEKVPTVLDADLGAREALAGILALTDYAIFCAPALREFAPGGNDTDRLERVLAAGPRHAGVTLGSEGYLWRDRDAGAHLPAANVSAADTTGAGDAFHGAFALMVAEGRPTAECARVATAVAGLKCTRLGSRAGLPTRAELGAYLEAKPPY